MTTKLSAQEEQAMRAVWKAGEGNIKTFLDQMDGKTAPPYTTLASTIKKLEKKGYLTSRLIGNTYLYKPAIDQKQHSKNSLSSLVKQHFNNSYKEMVAFFAQQKKITPKELQEIIQMIERHKK